MIERQVDVTTRHGLMPSFVAHPDGAGPWPAIIFYMDAPGIREELRNHARRIARQGYFCILPDMYYRIGTVRFDLVRRDEAMSTVVRAARRTLTDAAVNDDTASLLSFLDGQDRVIPGPVGMIGHCMSGRYITTTAARFPDRIKAAASLYGVDLVDDQPSSPHLNLGSIQAELYYGFGDRDKSTPPDYLKAFRAALKKSKLKVEMDVFQDTKHGYCFAERGAYNPVAAEASWGKIFNLWERNLKH